MNLNNVLEYETKKPQFVLIESNTDGSFLLHHFLSNLLKNNEQSSNIFMLTLAQTKSHYKSVQIKLGNSIALNQHLSDEKLITFDMMESLGELINPNDQNDKIEPILDTILTNLKEKIRQIKNKTNDSNFYVIIDDLSIASLMGASESYLFDFVNKIIQLDERLNLIAYVQSFYSNKYLINDWAHMADLFIKTECLTTGYTKEIDGQVYYFCKITD